MTDGQKASWDSSGRRRYDKIKCEDPYRLKGMKDEKQPAVMWAGSRDLVTGDTEAAEGQRGEGQASPIPSSQGATHMG